MYAPQHYEQDRKIALYVFNKDFKGHYLKDDLIQTAIIALWQLRQKHTYKDYVKCACTAAHNHMVSFLRKESRQFADSLFDSVGGDGDLQLIDVLAAAQATAVACKEINRNYIGIEIDPRWHKIALDRLNNTDAHGQISLIPR